MAVHWATAENGKGNTTVHCRSKPGKELWLKASLHRNI